MLSSDDRNDMSDLRFRWLLPAGQLYKPSGKRVRHMDQVRTRTVMVIHVACSRDLLREECGEYFKGDPAW